MSSAARPLPQALDHIVKRCLEKEPDERFHSAHDIAFDLERLATLSGPDSTSPMPLTRARSGGGMLAAVLVLGADSPPSRPSRWGSEQVSATTSVR